MALLVGVSAEPAVGQSGSEPTQAQIDAGLELLPTEVRSGAGVVVPGSDGDWRPHRPGTNGWTCRVWTVPGRLVANCHHTVLEGLLDRNAALYADGLRGDALFTALGEAMRSGALAIPSGSLEISVSGRISDPRGIPDEMSGNHFLYFPFADATELALPTEDPGEERPWLHNAGTAKAHVMWPRLHRPTAGGG